MEIKQYYLGCLSHASYMVSDRASKTAVIVDPQRDVDEYLRDAQSAGLTIKDVVLTHFHADFVAGHLELQRRTGAEISLGSAARPSYAFHPRKEGDEIHLGQTRLKFLETPGHTPEAVSILVFDDPHKDPQAVLTGDTLFVGDVGRPDLAVSTGASVQSLAGQLYDSLHDKLLTLPDATVVYPAHGPGSLCGSGNTGGKVSTIGRERAENPMLKTTDKSTFVDAITAHLPELPPYFAHDAAMNQGTHVSLEDSVSRQRQPLCVSQVEKLLGKGAQLLDTRGPDDFAAKHWKGSLNVGLDGRFAQWAGTLLDPDRQLVIVTDSGRETETLTRLGRIGIDRVVGYLEGGIGALQPYPEFAQAQPRIEAAHLSTELASPSPPQVIDVRTSQEYRDGHIAGSKNIPLPHLQERIGEIATDRPLVVHCQSGYRSSMAVSLLASQGLICATDLVGGIASWKQGGLPVTRG